MGLNRVHRLYTPKWQAGVSRAAETAYSADFTIYKVGESVYDAVTDTWTEVTTTWYTGPARVQPLRTTRVDAQPGNTTTVQAVLVSIPVDENTIDFRPGLLGLATSVPLNPSAEMYRYILVDVVDGSNPMERTLMFRVDQEARVG